ncbi:MAG: hypothetical protein V4858_15015 [Pseudomonadota bacterium]
MRKLIYTTLLLAGSVHAQDFIRSETFARPIDQSADGRERAQYVLGTPSRKWSGGFVKWYYNPSSQPANLTTDEVVYAMKVAAKRWSDMCRVTFLYMGLTNAAPYMGSVASLLDNKNVYGWASTVTTNSLYDMNRWFDVFNNYTDVDIALNGLLPWNAAGVDAAMTSAIGFSIGLKTSDVSSAVMANVPSRDLAYDRTLRGDDIAGCAALYGANSFYADSNRAFNWAESAYSNILWPSPAESSSYNGYYYRYYSGTDSLVATKDDTVYYVGPDGVLQNLGPLVNYKNQVQSAGY